MLKVASDLSWTLFFYNQRVEVDSCSVLASTQSVLRSPANLTNHMSVVSDSGVCVGNPDNRIRPLLARRQGVFMDYVVYIIHDESLQRFTEA